MGKLAYTLTNDVLFKLLFVRNQDLLVNLVAALLGIAPYSIENLDVTNSEMLPEVQNGKCCRLDINMRVDGRIVNLEVQVRDQGDYPERSLHNWARLYSGALHAGQDYRDLPRTIVVSIVEFPLFACAEFHSEFRLLEVSRGTQLTDRLCMHYFELSKLPPNDDVANLLELWLSLFKAQTDAELELIKNKGVLVMEQAVAAYHRVSATNEFAELERARQKAHHHEISVIRNAERRADERWQNVVAQRDAAHEMELKNKNAELKNRDAIHAMELQNKDTIIAKLMAQLKTGGK